ncbi:MAG: FkbM family methyltransferase [Solirubrobacteraceae bacterium]
MELVTRARRAFYNLDGPWHRNRLFEALGSQRYARPALFGLDRMLAELMPWRGGTFLEAGAHDGFTQSNTYFLERHLGWTGILVEPVPELARKCSLRRPASRVVECALVGPEHASDSVQIHFGDLMSTTGDPTHAAQGLEVAGRGAYSIAVAARTLDSVLDQGATEPLDVIVLDLEGRECDVLRGLDLERHGPRYLLIEALDLERARPSLNALLADHYQPRDPPSGYDLIYARRRS